jgi:hypothetical protein
MNKIIHHIAKAIREIIPAFIFFFIMFQILLVTRALMLKQFGIDAPLSAIAVIGAIIVAKVVLIADRIPFLNQYPKKPLIYNVVFKTIVFFTVAFILLMLEEYIHVARTNKEFTWTGASIRAHISWPIFWVRQIWLFVLLFFYCSASELARAIGRDRVREIFFGPTKK